MFFAFSQNDLVSNYLINYLSDYIIILLSYYPVPVW